MDGASPTAVAFAIPAYDLIDSASLSDDQTTSFFEPPLDDDVTDKQQDLNDERLVTVAERSTEVAASILVSVLQDEGIKAVAIGGFTAGFRAEAPGIVRVQTLEADADRARQIIAELQG